MDKEIDIIIENLEKLRQENKSDLIKFYYKKDDDYCFKFIRNEKIVSVIRRGLKRK